MFTCNYRNPMESNASFYLFSGLGIEMENRNHARMRKDSVFVSRVLYFQSIDTDSHERIRYCTPVIPILEK
jgi:hypothetical protein